MQTMTDQINREFNELWDDTVVKVRAYIFCICRDRNQVDDLTQECYLRAFRNWGQFDSKGPRQGWLFTIARRTCVDWFRGNTGDGHVSLDAIDELAQPACVDDNSGRIEIVWENIRQLQPEYSEILYLRFAGGLNYAEMAKTLDVPIGTVRSRLHRGLKALKSKFQGQ
jgi:RNA polymerase sigma-70 factor (ECF subfamily)